MDGYTTPFSVEIMNFTNHSTTINPPVSDNVEFGYICAIFSCVLFGSNLLPVKKFDTGDGLFFQWIACSGILIVGFVVNVIRGFPTFYYLVMIGGAMWATGNVFVVPIIQTIGLGLGLLIWASMNMLSGWASGRYGWFGINPDIPGNLTYNYIGVALAAVSGTLYLLVKPNVYNRNIIPDSLIVAVERDESSANSESDLNTDVTYRNFTNTENDEQDVAFWENMQPWAKRLFGCTLAIIAGILFGLSFTPALYCQNNYPGAKQHGLDYVFAEMCGIYCASTFYFMLYCVIKKNKPVINPKIVLPALLSGTMWAIAQSGWFVANSALGEAVSFPIITTGPSIIGALWAIFLFKEIQGVRNFLILGVAFAIGITGATFSALSF